MNATNLGSLMQQLVGLELLRRKYDFSVPEKKRAGTKYDATPRRQNPIRFLCEHPPHSPPALRRLHKTLTTQQLSYSLSSFHQRQTPDGKDGTQQKAKEMETALVSNRWKRCCCWLLPLFLSSLRPTISISLSRSPYTR